MSKKENRIASFIESLSGENATFSLDEKFVAGNSTKAINSKQCYNVTDSCNFSTNTQLCYNTRQCLGAANMITCHTRIPENPNCLCVNSGISCLL